MKSVLGITTFVVLAALFSITIASKVLDNYGNKRSVLETIHKEVRHVKAASPSVNSVNNQVQSANSSQGNIASTTKTATVASSTPTTTVDTTTTTVTRKTEENDD